MLKIVSVRHGDEAGVPKPFDTLTLASDERHLRRKALTLAGGERVMADFADPVVLAGGDLLVLEDGRCVRVVAAAQDLYDIRGRDPLHLAELAWHIGNRHLPAQVEAGHILIERDHVIRAMLEGLGAKVTDTRESFSPIRGAYSGGHTHGHHHGPDHSHLESNHHHGHKHG